MPVDRNHHILSLLFLGLLFGHGGLAYSQDAVKVNKQPAVVKYETFDPKNKPANMPPLTSSEAAVCHSAFGVACQMGVEVTDDNQAGGQHTVTAKVANVTVNTSLTITIWLPVKVAAQVKAHEEGHRRISESFYADAEKIARDLAGEYVGKSLVGRGRTADAAANAAMNPVISSINGKYMAATQIPAAKVNELFDQITSHGEKKVAVDKAIDLAMQRWRNESK